MNKDVTDLAWTDLAKALEVEETCLKAIARVETAGHGFVTGRSGRPKILFEGHAFHRLTGGQFDASHPHLSHAAWDPRKYARDQAGEWQRLDEACQLDRPAALQSASWGLFQVMGFNYPYCGHDTVEAFVAAQHTDADAHVSAFARLVLRPPFLQALRTRDWATFAAAYNGPGHAVHRYEERLAAAYAQLVAEAADATARTGTGHGRRQSGRASANASSPATAAVPSLPSLRAVPPGRSQFAPLGSVRRRLPKRRNVRPDPVDLRDWEYRPSIAIAPPDAMLPLDPNPTKQQGDTNACTGFALATVIEYLLDRGQRPVEAMSGHMLYNMARRYDEWAEEDEEDDSGSSLRGALKGWSRHGASCERLWPRQPMPRPRPGSQDDWWLDAVKRPLGAYYRIDPDNIRDIHIALREAGAVYASAFTHKGWDAQLQQMTLPAPTQLDEIPAIKHHSGSQEQGHAFAIVGYTRAGFIIQNSWGAEWGRGGFAVLTYEDWTENAMDCWVVQLGVVTVEHEAVAGATTMRLDARTGAAIISRNTTLADHEIAPFIINMENEGQLSHRGRFRTGPEDLRLLLEHHLPEACRAWGLETTDTVDIALYAHGGLTGEEAAAATARSWIPHLYTEHVFPIFLMWETDAFSTLSNIFEDAVKGEAEKTGGERWNRFRRRFEEWRDERLEGLARLPGGKLWGQMKQNADALSGAKNAGIVQLFELFKRKDLQARLPRIRLHLIGHSAGTIVHTWLGGRALRRGLDVGSISLLAPAVRLDLFDQQLGGHVAQRRIPVLVSNLTDAAERADPTCKPYGKSLLYLVARSFEDHEETALLGMEKHLVPALPTHAWGSLVRQLPTPGGAWAPNTPAARATTHGGLDNDAAIREAVTAFIKARA
ncbi:N-acetylmuramidase domain-containing protein [Aerolutibacter ruishenii]|uniref:Papain like protease n=1 Tax=Aerolutibacter ruishenii TaxID=686800 RepID=A0A562LVJ4_9GAMM|nr:N-acetylmuramidase domain-containing protein [Lysobacter ruishenii]TWI11655.1 papain like protease [Lysobacter ruishenii]